eukprot:Sspe_Gene.4473::Locus_1473_Transcript_1_1_Confidence_1.000_Length_1463::g.4473::m.4473/K14797/ENP1, BYSL; essential nuclear protein 1
MGKMTQRKRAPNKHDPLALQLKKDKEAHSRRPAKKTVKFEEGDDTCGHGGDGLEMDDQGFAIPNSESTKILRQAREQLDHDVDMDMDDGASDATLEFDDQSSVATETPIEDHEDFEVDEEEERLLQQFAPQSIMQSRNLADIIMGKIRNKEREADEEMSRGSRPGGSSIGGTKFDARVVKVYKTVGKLLRRYTTGKIPKAFKVLPNLQGWEELLFMTAPHEWSPHALYAATRIFAHTSNEKMAQRFYNIVLLPSIRSMVKRTGRLHSHMYAAIRKAMWKPGAFNKGFLIPLAAEEDLSIKEALIVASVLTKSSLPRAHAMVAILKISQMPYNGSSSVLLRAMLDKAYDMPYQVVDALVKHFHGFVYDNREFPVLWHQCLLTFIQRYKGDLVEEQVELIRKVVNKHHHPYISSEIRRELLILENEWKKTGGAPRAAAPVQ